MKQFLWTLALCFLSVPLASATPRPLSDRMTNPDQLNAVKRAVVERINVDDAAIRAGAFPERPLVAFDRDGDGAFYTADTAWGLYDYHMAIVQFIHDTNDHDGDGVPGFYELECSRAGGPDLDPNEPQTAPGTNDGEVDCDGDGIGNVAELGMGLNPLDPQDGEIDSDHDGVSDAAERVAGTRHTPLVYLVQVAEDSADHISFALRHDLHPQQPAMVIADFYLDYDSDKVTFDSAVLGQAAIDAGKLPNMSDLGSQVRAFVSSFNLNGIQSGDVVVFRFEKNAGAAGPIQFTIDTQDSTISPQEARAELTYGVGHPDEPLMIGGE